MATNHLLPSAHADGLARMRTTRGIGLALLAFLLALTLGLSAADIQRQRAADAQAAASGETELRILDGRGKWGGYM